MKASVAACKIKAVHLGEAWLNLIKMDQAPLRAKFALLDEEGNACGFVEKQIWSEATLEALQKFAEVLENEVLGVIFVQPATDAQGPEITDETPQF